MGEAAAPPVAFGDSKPVSELLALDEYVVIPEYEARIGRSAQRLLTLTRENLARNDWEHAEEYCNSALAVSDLAPEYRGKINIPLVLGLVHYYQGIALVGQGEVMRALLRLRTAGDELAFIAPLTGAAIWLARAQVQENLGNRIDALWDAERSWNLVQDAHEPQREALKTKIDDLFKKIL